MLDTARISKAFMEGYNMPRNVLDWPSLFAGYPRPLLDLKKHCYESQDGRHWSSPEMAQFMDGRVTQYQMNMAAKARWDRESQFFVPKGIMPS